MSNMCSASKTTRFENMMTESVVNVAFDQHRQHKRGVCLGCGSSQKCRALLCCVDPFKNLEREQGRPCNMQRQAKNRHAAMLGSSKNAYECAKVEPCNDVESHMLNDHSITKTSTLNNTFGTSSLNYTTELHGPYML